MSDEENYDDNVEPEDNPDEYAEDAQDDGDVEEKENPDAELLREWMDRKGCWCDALFAVLVEFEFTDPTLFQSIDDEMFDALKHEALESPDVNAGAVTRFEKLWRNRSSTTPRQMLNSGGKSPNAKRGRGKRGGRGRRGRGQGRSPGASPRRGGGGGGGLGSRQGSQRGNAPTPQDGQGLELRRWLKQKGVWQMELWEVLVQKGIDNEEQVAALKKWEVDEVIRDTKLQYSQQGVNSSMQRNRFEKNLLRFSKVHRDVATAETLLDREQMRGTARIDSAARSTKKLPEARELRSLLKREDVWVVELFRGLVEIGVEMPDQLWETPEHDVEDLIRRLKVQRAKENTNARMRDLFDTKMVRFRVMWRRNNMVEEYEDE